MRLLVIEDHPRVALLLERGLQEEGYSVDVAGTAADGISRGLAYDYDAIVLDLVLPDGDGVDALRRLRENGRWPPVLILTARDGVDDRVRGLDAGADDYLVKPFNFDELLARIRALQRRPGGTDGRVLRRGPLALDLVTREVMAGDFALHLTATEFRILELLMVRAPAVVDRQLIAQHAWKDETQPLGSNAIDVRMARLRAKLAGTGAEVVTVRGSGYRLSAT
jgi:two-component system OmpR family response regulator